MKLGCHAVLFGEKIKSETEAVLDKLASTGAKGVEIGVRFFGVKESGKLKEELSKRGLELSGYHMMTSLTDWLDHPEKCQEILGQGADFLQDIPNKNIIMTGMIPMEAFDRRDLGDERLTKKDTLKEIVRAMDCQAQRLWQEKGVRLHYHNHNWELKNQALLYRLLLEEAEHLFLAMDIGWVAVSGYDPFVWLEKYPHRFCYLHLRDYKEKAKTLPQFAQIRESYVELGSGDMNYPDCMNQVKQLLPQNTWLIVEYETGEVDEMRYQRAISVLTTLL